MNTEQSGKLLLKMLIPNENETCSHEEEMYITAMKNVFFYFIFSITL